MFSKNHIAVSFNAARCIAYITAILISVVLMGTDIHGEVHAIVEDGVLVITSNQEQDVIALSGHLDGDLVLTGGISQSFPRTNVSAILVRGKNDRVGIANFEFDGDVILHLGNQGSLTSLQDVRI